MPVDRQADLDDLLRLAPAIALRALGTGDDDAVQDLREGMLRAAQSFDPGRGVPFRSWVSWKAIRLTLDVYRKRTNFRVRRQVEFVSIDEREWLEPGEMDAGFDRVDSEQCAEMIARHLTGSGRDLEVMLGVLSGLQQAEIAAIHGVSQSRVSQIVSRSVARMVESMAAA